MAKPSPTPRDFVVNSGSKSLRIFSGGMPIPVSATFMEALCPSFLVVMVRAPPSGIACTALPIMLISARCIRNESTSRAGRLGSSFFSITSRSRAQSLRLLLPDNGLRGASVGFESPGPVGACVGFEFLMRKVSLLRDSIFELRYTLPGETELGSAGEQPNKG